MLRNRTSLVGALLAVGALGATAGMMAVRWSQRHRAQRTSYYRDLNRWEDEGGALDANGSGATASAAFGSDRAGATLSGAAPRSDGAAGAPWPFPHGRA
jgi:hypothetical protein